MAEFTMKDLIKRDKIDGVSAYSMALTNEEIGNSIYYRAKSTLLSHNITIYDHRAIRFTYSDYDKYDEIYYMDSENLWMLLRVHQDTNHKYMSLLDKEIEDPWYTNNFEKVYNEIYLGVSNIINNIKRGL
ncbi:MAG: low molecular weight phosphotyrosine protein phosphatase [Gammaproteobacteria bacterium]|nr:low molecular weight phosphotyrosine protein phosphatase [Gammaproteobacteria bacterium]